MIFEGEETEGTGNWRGRRGDPEKKSKERELKGREREGKEVQEKREDRKGKGCA